MADLVKDFLDYIKYVRAYSPHTLTAYRHDLGEWQEYLREQGADLERINMRLARSYMALLRRKVHPRAMSNRSINRRISTLKSFYKYLQKCHMAESGMKIPKCNNPWDSLSLLPQPQRLPNYLSLEELQKLAATCPTAFRSLYLQKLCSAVLELGFSSGMRVSELCSLNVAQLFKRVSRQNENMEKWNVKVADLERRLLIVGKGGKQRFVFMGPGSAASLAAYLAERLKFLSQHKGAADEKALFCNGWGARLQPRSVHRILAHLGRVAGMERPLHPHLLRHSFATTILNHGAGIRSVQELLGHSSLNSTQMYTHVGIQHLRDIHRIAHPRATRKQSHDSRE